MSRLNDSELPFSLLQFYATSPYPCSYLPDREARSLVATPAHLVTTEVYSALVRSGFRRSGVFAYRPDCHQCRACLSVRLPVFRLQPNRSQKRAWRQHAGLEAKEVPLLYTEAHFELYNRYQLSRHAGSGMDLDSREQYAQFLLQSHIDTRLVEFREAGQLRMVSLIDVLDDGLSSVYTFYDPDIANASYGTYNVLWQVEQARQRDLPYLYLGYWIAGCRKMAYKSRFRPLQVLRDNVWQELSLDSGSVA